jgi:tctex1 domain-containing protein 2
MSQPADESANKVTELSYRDKVPVVEMKKILHECLVERLTGQAYEGDKCSEAAKQLADIIRNRLKYLGYDRYKFIVQVVIGERRDQGVYFGTRCFWDANTDNQASETFTNDHIFCTATSYAVYLY